MTIATYQMLTYRPEKNGGVPAPAAVRPDANWGLIIYDEVHLLPAPVFRVTAEIQARRRLGLTATLVREDGREDDVFSLIGPKKYDVPWKDLEEQGWIATAPAPRSASALPEDVRMAYAVAEPREKYRIAAENPRKLAAVARDSCEQHPGDQMLIIGQYLDQLQQIAAKLDAPLITGKTPQRERERLYEDFRQGEERRAGRLQGRQLRHRPARRRTWRSRSPAPSARARRRPSAWAASCAPSPTAGRPTSTRSSPATRSEQDFALNRQLFLTEQGYRYQILDADELMGN